MAVTEIDGPKLRKPLRLWPGVVIVALQWLLRFGVPAVEPDALELGVYAGFFGGGAIVLWWLLFSRAPWSERVGGVVLMLAALYATSLVVHESIATGAMGMLFFILAIPVLSLAFVVWAVAARGLTGGARWATMAAAIALACGVWALARTGGLTGNFDNDLVWRWTETPEERLLARAGEDPVPPPRPSLPPVPTPSAVETAEAPAQSGDEPAAVPAAPAVAEPGAGQAEPESPAPESPAERPEPAEAAPEQDATGRVATPSVAAAPVAAAWPGFRGPGRDGVVRGVRIGTDWAASPPAELWRRPVGPGWSSFAVRGDRVYTQEQRGDDEAVTCYDAATGEPVWRHRDAARFWESNAGAGPRGTPTLTAAPGRVYTFGATGIANALDAETGAVVWSRNAAEDAEAEVPHWGFSSSPLVVGDVVVVAVGGRLVGYDAATGDPRWMGPSAGGSYSSPHLVTLGGVEQVLLLRGAGIASVAPADGTPLWEYASPGGSRMVQPAVIANGELLITGGEESAARRIAVARGGEGWTVEDRWTTRGLKPYFNDLVVHGGHAYGFDGSILACIDLEDGERRWKGGRYGHGQLVLLPDQDVLLVLSERGELALVSATPEKFTELVRIEAITGKTWNHPVLAGDLLLVRNDQEMAAFRLPPAAPAG